MRHLTVESVNETLARRPLSVPAMNVPDADSELKGPLMQVMPPHFTGTVSLSMISENAKWISVIVPSKLPVTMKRPAKRTDVTAFE